MESNGFPAWTPLNPEKVNNSFMLQGKKILPLACITLGSFISSRTHMYTFQSSKKGKVINIQVHRKCQKVMSKNKNNKIRMQKSIFSQHLTDLVW